MSPVPSSSDPTTDPGRRVLESLYRGSPARSGVQAYEPSLRPPEGTHDYSWLFRPDEPASPVLPVPAALAATTTTGLAVATRWPDAAVGSARRWPAVALLAVALASAVLLPWAAHAF